MTTLPPLKGFSLINVRDWDSEKWRQRPIGEVPVTKTNRPYNGQWVQPAGLFGQHICHHDYFETGQPWPYTGPLIVYDVQWIPECCRFGDDALGGFELGGEAGDKITYTDATAGGYQLGGAAGDVLLYLDQAAGGVEVGGAVGDVLLFLDPAAGGMELGGDDVGDVWEGIDPTEGGVDIGGEVGDVFTPPSPGGTCAAALAASFGTTYPFAIGAGVQHWFQYVNTPFVPRTITITVTSGTVNYNVWDGGSCAGLTPIAAGSGSATIPYTALLGATFLWVQLTGVAPTSNYTLNVT